jgi:hypothetical protein
MIRPHAVEQKALARGLQPLLKPILRAYALGFASSTTPRVLTLLLTHLSKSRRKSVQDAAQDDFFASLVHILAQGLKVQRFATFCALLTGGSTILQARPNTDCLLLNATNHHLDSFTSITRKGFERMAKIFKIEVCIIEILYEKIIALAIFTEWLEAMD